MYKGTFLAVEGQDYSGKTTQIDLMETYLLMKNIDFVSIRSPGGSKAAEDMRDVIMNNDTSPITDLLLFTAARIELSINVIEPALKEGKIVICDRYNLSTVAYQKYGDRLHEEYFHLYNCVAGKWIEPDRHLIFLVSEEEVTKRKLLRKEVNRLDNFDLSKMERINNAYDLIGNDFNIKRIYTDKSIEDVQSEVNKWLEGEFLPIHFKKLK